MIEKRSSQLGAVEQQIFDASASSDSIKLLRSMVQELAHHGNGRQEIYEMFERVVLVVRDQHDGADSVQEDALLDVMDLLTGFCKPDLTLLPDET